MNINSMDVKKAVRIHKVGEPDVMQYEEMPLKSPGNGEALVRVKAIGVNFHDIYMRTGLYPSPYGLPIILGGEGSGVVEKVGPEVTHIKPGDRVAWTDVYDGSYATHVVASSDRLVSLPDDLTFEQGAAAMLQGLTAHFLMKSTTNLKKDDVCLIQAAAGGVGLLLCQIGKMLGLRIIGTVSNKEKAKFAREAGADEIIYYTRENILDKVTQFTNGEGVDVAFDSVGKDTFEQSLASLKTRGMLVSFGQSSGLIPSFDILKLKAKSLYITRPYLFNYITTRKELVERTNEIFNWIIAGKLNIKIACVFPLEKAADAHRTLTDRKSSGKILLIP